MAPQSPGAMQADGLLEDGRERDLEVARDIAEDTVPDLAGALARVYPRAAGFRPDDPDAGDAEGEVVVDLVLNAEARSPGERISTTVSGGVTMTGTLGFARGRPLRPGCDIDQVSPGPGLLRLPKILAPSCARRAARNFERRCGQLLPRCAPSVLLRGTRNPDRRSG